jgi:hypothetical protein
MLQPTQLNYGKIHTISKVKKNNPFWKIQKRRSINFFLINLSTFSNLSHSTLKQITEKFSIEKLLISHSNKQFQNSKKKVLVISRTKGEKPGKCCFK